MSHSPSDIGSKVLVRQATVEDVAVVHQLIQAIAKHHSLEAFVQVTEEILARDGFGSDAKFGVLLAEVDGNVVGYASYTWFYGIWLGATTMLIDDVFIWETYRGLGIGNMLMQKAKDVALANGVARMKWEVEADNHGAIRFYKRLGVSVDIKGVCRWDLTA